MDSIEAYVSGSVRNKLSEKYGPDIYQLQTDYFNADKPKSFLNQHPELKKFWDEKKVLETQGEQMFNDMGSKLPEAKGAQFQPGYTPQSGVQSTLYNNLQSQQQIPDWNTESQNIPHWLQSEIANHAQDGKGVSKRASSELDFLATKAGYKDGKDYLRKISLAFQQSMNAPQGQPSPPNGGMGAGVNMFGVAQPSPQGGP